jgi:hypothetical protein
MEMIEARERVASEVHSDYATAAARKRAEVAERLGLLEDC